MERLPRHFKVGSSRYSITRDPNVVDDEDGPVLGLTIHQSNTVYVAPGMARDRTSDVSLHEALHVMLYKAGIDISERQEEKLVSQLTPVLLDFIRDNITFINYLINNAG